MSVFVLHCVVLHSRSEGFYFPSLSAKVKRDALVKAFFYIFSGVTPVTSNLSEQKICCRMKCESEGPLLQKMASGLSALIFPQEKEIQPLRASLLITGGRP